MNFVALFGNIWVRRAALAVVVLIALLAVRQHYIDKGKTEGITQANQSNAQVLEQQWEKMRAETNAKLDQFQQRIEASNAAADAYRNAAQLLASQRSAAAAHVAGMNDEQVTAVVNRELGRLATDSSQYTTENKKKIADCFTQRPLLEQTVQQKTDEATTLRGTIALQGQQYNVLGAYTTLVENDFTTLFNQNAAKRRGPQCLWIWKCGRRTIDVNSIPPLLKQRPVRNAQ